MERSLRSLFLQELFDEIFVVHIELIIDGIRDGIVKVSFALYVSSIFEVL